ncbi:NAD(P)-binding protein [Aspergillus sclerotiicarbonarius CBS 121057]|uniref:NAD(P)-binding protein n=1 Tax=Aspergillus sclerotiicarbonarius (strain CBS 121057 / IBT 28362) TaxID=1448318 RepID=A0A319EI89_ASPSB|nr:NAD(P)-binding protein [Aspergillus sclerotiicarbonarius CBS 121057]
MTIFGTHLTGVALIVGCNEIGREAGLRIADAGARVVVFADIDARTAQDCSAESKGYKLHHDYQTAHFHLESMDRDKVQDMVDFVVKGYGRIDYAVNTTGLYRDRDGKMDDKGMASCCEVEAAAMCKQSQLELVYKGFKREIGQGMIVNVTPANPGAAFIHYRHAAIHLTKKTAIRQDSSCRIRCNLVCPYWVRDQHFHMESNIRQNAQQNFPYMAADLDEVADTIAFMISPSASYINAKCLVLDGGREESL